MKKQLVVCLLTAMSLVAALRAMTPMPDRVVCSVPDRQPMQTPDAVRLTGWMG